MQGNNGWIKVHRELLDKPIWKLSTPEQKTILIALLLMANHKEKKWEWNGRQFICKPGQFITSTKKIAEAAGDGISIKNVRTAIERFENLGFLANESAKTGRLITIVNWEDYQIFNEEGGKEIGRKPANEKYEQSMNISDFEDFPAKKLANELAKHEIDENVVKSVLSELQNLTMAKNTANNTAGSRQRPGKDPANNLATNKNIKNNNNKKNNIKTLCTPEADALFERLWNRYPSKKGKARITDKKKLEFLEIGEEQMNRCIDRYLADLEKDSWRHPQNGSTFFTSGYVDYLDNNFGIGDKPKKESSPEDRFSCLDPKVRSELERSGIILGQSIAVENASKEEISLLQREGLL